MVTAILEGRKTQTRRVLKRQPPEDFSIPIFDGFGRGVFADIPDENYMDNWPEDTTVKCPYGKPGDRLWVRESFATVEYPHAGQVRSDVVYRADDCQLARDIEAWAHSKIVWTSSIHMPRIESRITLEITNVRVERLHEINHSDLRREGVLPSNIGGELKVLQDEYFRPLWDKINGKKHPWAENPWVWVVEFSLLKEDRRTHAG
jgi:hypothetical protein